jgi:hypothetical protein
MKRKIEEENMDDIFPEYCKKKKIEKPKERIFIKKHIDINFEEELKDEEMTEKIVKKKI